MSNNLITKKIENLSFFRLSGIRKFIILDIYKNYVNITFLKIKEPPYYLTKESLITSFNILFSELLEYGNDLSIISQKLNGISKKYKLDEAFILVGINEFRFKTIKIAKDLEDKELWFLENTNKFLPEGRLTDDFLYSYEKYYEDEENEYYYIIISRRTYIDEIINACQTGVFKVANISALPLAIHTLNFAKEKNILFLNIGFEKINYSYSNDKHVLFYGESFLVSNKNNSFNNTSSLYFTDFDAISNCLNEIKQNLSSFLPNFENNLNIYFSTLNSNPNEIIPSVKSVFLTDLINEKPFNFEQIHLNSLSALNNLFNGNDSAINLLPSDVSKTNRDLLEKKTTLRFTLFFGVLLIFLLLFIYSSENWLNNQIQKYSNNLVELDVKSKMVENYKKENIHLINNLSVLNTLKSDRIIYSKILHSITSLANNKSCFTKLRIKELNKELSLNLKGLAYSQKNVTEIINNVEKLDGFYDVSLEYANTIDQANIRSKVILPKKTMINFSFSANYYANQK